MARSGYWHPVTTHQEFSREVAGRPDGWYWCLRHERVERGAQSCPADVRMGPYSSEADARNWRDQAEARNERWEAEDREWTGEDDP